MSDQIKVELQESLGSDRSIANSAWTSSFDKEKRDARTDEDVKRVVNMLADSKHSVPFESVVFRFWFRLPIATDRQLMTHRIASHSGLSGRYRTVPTDYLQMPEEVKEIFRKSNPKDNNWKWDGQDFIIKYVDICEQANNEYINIVDVLKEAKENKQITNEEYKRAREFARGILPQHNMTERTTVMNLRSFANFIKLRNKPEAQPEIRDLAQKMLESVKASGVCPIAIEALERNNWVI